MTAKLKHGQTVVFLSPKGRYVDYKVLSHHPEFNALTCRRNTPGSKPMIRSMEGCLLPEEAVVEQERLRKEGAVSKYGWLAPLVKAHGFDHRKIAQATGKLPVAVLQQMRKARREGVVE